MKKTTPRQPFFARLLEAQELEQVSGGATMKHPSDGDDKNYDLENARASGGKTQKYPSDGDETGV